MSQGFVVRIVEQIENMNDAISQVSFLSGYSLGASPVRNEPKIKAALDRLAQRMKEDPRMSDKESIVFK